MSQGSVGQGIGEMEKGLANREARAKPSSPEVIGKERFSITASRTALCPLAGVVHSIEGSVYGIKLLQLPNLHAKRSGE